MYNGNFLIQEPGWWQAFQRRFQTGEDRWSNLNHIRVTIEEALTLMCTYMNAHSDQKPGHNYIPQLYTLPTPNNCLTNIRNIVRELQNSTKGINNLKETYRGDVGMLSHLDLLSQRIDVEIGKGQSYVEINDIPCYLLPRKTEPLDIPTMEDVSGPVSQSRSAPGVLLQPADIEAGKKRGKKGSRGH